MKQPFKTSHVEGKENVMVLGDINPSEIRFNIETRELYLVLPDVYTIEDLDGLSWQKIRDLVEKHDGKWKSKADGIKYLVGKSK